MTEVHFCNLCDQSVPQDQLEAGAAIRHGGRILCASCRDALALAGGGARPSGRGGLAVVLVVGLIGWAAAAYVWLEQQDLRADLMIRADGNASQLASDLRGVERRLEDRLVRLDERADVQDVALASLRQDQARAAEAMAQQLGALERAVERVPDLADAVDRVEGRMREVEAARAVMGQESAELRGALEVIRDGLAELERSVAAAPAPAAEGGFPREIEDLIAQLRDPDALQRSIALEKLGQSSDPRLVAYVEPLLRDSYEMNRYYAATSLGSWRAASSVPVLIEALADEYSLVRKAANDALMAITGADQGFDAKAPEAERRKAIERWRAWSERGAAPAGAD